MGRDDDDLQATAIAMRRAGRTRREIREALGIGESRLSDWVRDIPPGDRSRRPRAKDDLRDRARELRGLGWSISQVAEELGSPRSSIVRWTRDTESPIRAEPKRWAKTAERERALQLREKGLACGEIAREVGVSKSTVSLWMRHVPIKISEEERLVRLRRAAKTGPKQGSIRRRASARRHQEKLTASRDIRSLSDRELFLLGVGLYWSEGSKDKPYLPRRSERVKFVNSDPGMIQVFVAWLAMLGYPLSDLTFRVQIHETADDEAAVRYWAALVGVEAAEFGKTTLKRHKPKTNRLNTGDSYHGCLSITVRRGAALYRCIEGWWQGIVVDSRERDDNAREPGWGPRAVEQPDPWRPMIYSIGVDARHRRAGRETGSEVS